jgi:hypothetical protein
LPATTGGPFVGGEPFDNGHAPGSVGAQGGSYFADHGTLITVRYGNLFTRR